MRSNIKVFSTATCPKCVALKEFLTSFGMDFEVCDIESPENMLFLMTWDGLPSDGGAPTLAIIDMDGHEDPICYTHRQLFDKGRLKTEFLQRVFGESVGQVIAT